MAGIRLPRVDHWRGQFVDILGTSIRPKIPAVVGHPNDQSLVYATDNDEPGLVWVHGGNLSGAHLAYNEMPYAREHLVWGSYVKLEQGVNGYIIVSMDAEYSGIFFDGYTPQDQKPVYMEQIMYGTLQPNPDTSNPMKALCIGAIVDDTRLKDQLTGDFSTGTVQDTSAANIVIPTSGNTALGVLVQRVVSSGEVQYKQGSEFSSLLTHKQAFDAGYYPTKDTGTFRLGWIKLVNGMTSISPSHIHTRPDIYSLSPSANLPITLTSAFTIASNEQKVVGRLILDSGGSITVDGLLTIV